MTDNTAAKASPELEVNVHPPVKPAEEPQDEVSVTRHSIKVNGQTLHYTVTAGTMILPEEKHTKEGEFEGHKPRARIFFVAYALDTKNSDQDSNSRPVTFAFNGGPGSPSLWLHMGLLGPRRVVMGDAGALTGPPYAIVDNEFTLLTHSDLVFIDPVSTGYSRAVEGDKPADFHGYKKDIESMGDFIRLWTSRAERWLSPKFLIGESYGTMRSAGLSGYLQERHGMFLNGIMLISTFMDYATVDMTPGHDLAYITHLPTQVATAWYHGKIGKRRSLKAVLKEAETFADGEYAHALHLGARLGNAERRRVAQKYSRLTSLSTEFILHNDLRVNLSRFRKELLRDQHLTVGRLDSRFTGIDRDSSGETPEYDPSYSAILGPYTATFNHYVRQELGFKSDLAYEVLSGRVRPWSYKEFEGRHVRSTDTLRSAMHQNQHLKVLIAFGYYDFATPYWAARYTFDHMHLDPGLRKNIREYYYEAGHMMYAHMPSFAQQYQDLAEFIEWAK